MLSDPLVPFAGARVESLLDVRLAEGATLVAVEALAAGRVATGERWAAARCQTRLRVRRDGVMVLDDALLLDSAHGDVRERMGPFDAWASVVLAGPGVLGPAEDLLRLARPHHRLADGAGAIELASPIEGGCLLRIAGDLDGYSLGPGSGGARVRRSAARGRSVHPSLVGRRMRCT